MKPIHKLGKDNHKLNGYRILTMESIVGKLTDRIVARKLARDLKDREIIHANQQWGLGEGQIRKMHVGKPSCICL